jgi:hypothetical protein
MIGIKEDSPLQVFVIPLARDIKRKGRLVSTARVFSRMVSAIECFFLGLALAGRAGE